MGESPSDQPECKTSSVRLSDPRSSGLGGRRPGKHPMGKPGRLCFSCHHPTAQGFTKTSIANVQANTYSTRLAEKAVVLGPSGNITGCTTTTSSDLNLIQTTTEQPLPHQPDFPQPPCLVSRSTVLQQCGFTAEVTERIVVPQRLSTRDIYSSKWSVFQRWCVEQQLDFRNHSIGDICNFFWYLFHDLNICPSTIEGYRTAIEDTLGNSKLHISSNTDIPRLIASFYRDKPKVSRSLQKWNVSLVLQKLTQHPFKPNEEYTLKPLTWKTVFLLALAPSKRPSKIHAWTYDRTLSLGNWEQVQLTPSPSFIAMNQLARGVHNSSPW